MSDQSHAPQSQSEPARSRVVETGIGSEFEAINEFVPWMPAFGGMAALPNSADPLVRRQAIQRLQRLHGNQRVGRLLGGGAGAPAPQTDMHDAPAEIQRDGAAAAPTRDTVIPFDHSPKALPGEKIIFNDDYKHATPTDYQLVFTGTGGKFDSDGGAASKTVAGLNSGNVFFFIASDWDGTSAVTVKLEVQKVSDKSVVLTDSWTFSKKTNLPTTITQKEAETERALGSVYEYKLGPDIGGDGKDDYIGFTVLEKFGTRTSNLKIEDMKEDWLKARPHLKTESDLTAHFFGTSSNNGTFTVSTGDKMYDVHNGGMHDKSVFEAALTTMKEIYVDLPQTYEVKPGVALGNYTIRRILKVDGTKKLRKMKT